MHRGAGRFRTLTDWADTRHSFSFGEHYDPGNTSFGALLVHNEDRVRSGSGYRRPSAPRRGDHHLGAVGLVGARGLPGQHRHRASAGSRNG